LVLTEPTASPRAGVEVVEGLGEPLALNCVQSDLEPVDRIPQSSRTGSNDEYASWRIVRAEVRERRSTDVFIPLNRRFQSNYGAATEGLTDADNCISIPIHLNCS